MSFLPMPFSDQVPLLETHSNYPGSWTWQAAYDEPIGNPGAYYYGNTAPSWGLYGSGLGAVSEEERSAMVGRVEMVEAWAQDPPVGVTRSIFSSTVGALRESLMRNTFPAWGGLWGFLGNPSSGELVARLNNAHSLFISRVPEEGRGQISPTAIDPETGAPRADSPWSTFFEVLPGEIREQAESMAPKWAMGGVGLAALLLGGVFVYSYVRAKGAKAGGR